MTCGNFNELLAQKFRHLASCESESAEYEEAVAEITAFLYAHGVKRLDVPSITLAQRAEDN